MKDGRGLGLLALGATWLLAKMPEEGALTQGYLAAMSNDVIKGAFCVEMKEKGDLPWFTKDCWVRCTHCSDYKARGASGNYKAWGASGNYEARGASGN